MESKSPSSLSPRRLPGVEPRMQAWLGDAGSLTRSMIRSCHGRFQVEVVAHDRYGNETTWMRSVLVDRTPPRLSLKGPAERGPGRQWIEIESDEPLDSLTCVGKTFEVEGEDAEGVVPGIRFLKQHNLHG